MKKTAQRAQLVCCELLRVGDRTRLASALLTLLLALSLASCEKIQSLIGRSTIPNLGPPIPVTAQIAFDPSLSKATLQYTNACNAPQQLRVGDELESALLQASHQTFKTIYVGGKVPSGAKPDVDILIALQQSGLQIQTDGIYDRLPADLTLGAVVLFKDSSGKVLLEQPINITRREKLVLEPTQHRCEYVTTDAMMHDAAVSMAIQFIRHARALLDPDSQLAGAAPEQPAPQPAPAAAAPPVVAAVPLGGAPVLSFKATVLDENSNLVLEGGERVKVRVDLVNAGKGAARDVSVTLSGTPAVISQFPATTLPVGAVQPGESRSVEFSATLPPAVQAQQAHVQVSVAEASGAGIPATQTLVLAMRQGGGGPAPFKPAAPPSPQVFQYADVDRIPVAAAGFTRPQTHLVAIGISSYRDQQIPPRKYAARDAELVAGYFQALGGVPASNVRLLQDRKALRPDIEEALLDWLPMRVTADSVVILYFSGHALVSPTGETYLAPYEGSTTSASRLYPLRDLEDALAKLKVRHSLLIFDGAVSRLGKGKVTEPQWSTGGRNLVGLIGTSGLRSGLEPDQVRHGLFTYYLLSGMKGEADSNQDREVTLGELAAFLSRMVPAAARSQFSLDQRPLVVPPLSPSSKAATLTLTRTAATAAGQ
jgi:hypothetical protein